MKIYSFKNLETKKCLKPRFDISEGKKEVEKAVKEDDHQKWIKYALDHELSNGMREATITSQTYKDCPEGWRPYSSLRNKICRCHSGDQCLCLENFLYGTVPPLIISIISLIATTIMSLITIICK